MSDQPSASPQSLMVLTLTKTELAILLDEAAEKGAKKALADVGLDGEHAQSDIRDLRTLLRSINLAKRTAWQTTVRVVTAGILAALIAGVAVKLKFFGGP